MPSLMSWEQSTVHQMASVTVAAPLSRVSEDRAAAQWNPGQRSWLWEGSHSLATVETEGRSPPGHHEAPVLCAQQGTVGASWGLLWGQCHPLYPGGLCCANDRVPSPSAPSTATTPAAMSPTCSARPWASPPPRWTAPSGQAAGTLARLGGRAPSARGTQRRPSQREGPLLFQLMNSPCVLGVSCGREPSGAPWGRLGTCRRCWVMLEGHAMRSPQWWCRAQPAYPL